MQNECKRARCGYKPSRESLSSRGSGGSGASTGGGSNPLPPAMHPATHYCTTRAGPQFARVSGLRATAPHYTQRHPKERRTSDVMKRPCPPKNEQPLDEGPISTQWREGRPCTRQTSRRDRRRRSRQDARMRLQRRSGATRTPSLFLRLLAERDMGDSLGCDQSLLSTSSGLGLKSNWR